MEATHIDPGQAHPSYAASLGGFLRPGAVTAREGAAGLTLLAGVAAALVAAGVTWVLRTRTSR